jgi:uncharacterized phage protein (TIGR02220 family)
MDIDFKGIWIPKEFYLITDLSWTEKILLVEIQSLDKGGAGCFASNEHFAKFLMLSEGTVANLIIKLIDKGYIIKKGFDGRKRYISVNSELINTLTQVSQNNEVRVNKNVNSESIKTLKQSKQKHEHNNTVNKTTTKTTNKTIKKNIISEQKIEDVKYHFEFEQIISLLEERTNAKYRLPTTASALTKYKNYITIKERLEEGATIEECLKIVETKFNEWSGTNMEKYLVPETLFRKSNFDKYLVQTQIKTPQKQNQNGIRTIESEQEIRLRSTSNIYQNALNTLNEEERRRNDLIKSLLNNSKP